MLQIKLYEIRWLTIRLYTNTRSTLIRSERAWWCGGLFLPEFSSGLVVPCLFLWLSPKESGRGHMIFKSGTPYIWLSTLRTRFKGDTKLSPDLVTTPHRSISSCCVQRWAIRLLTIGPTGKAMPGPLILNPSSKPKIVFINSCYMFNNFPPSNSWVGRAWRNVGLKMCQVPPFGFEPFYADSFLSVIRDGGGWWYRMKSFLTWILLRMVQTVAWIKIECLWESTGLWINTWMWMPVINFNPSIQTTLASLMISAAFCFCRYFWLGDSCGPLNSN